MTNIYMATIPIYQETSRNLTLSNSKYSMQLLQEPVVKEWKLHIRDIVRYFYETDVKDWQIGIEKGRSGYEHYQIRFRSCEELEKIRQNPVFYSGKVSRADNWTNYERKDGRYISSEDTTEIRKVRFGIPNLSQKAVINVINEQSVREIDVWYDPKGNVGKSWLCNHLYETGKGFYCPPTLDTVKGLIQFIANGYRGEEIIVIDIPRSWKWSEQLYTVIESIKDGLIYDSRYHTTVRNIRGVKVLVMCNTEPKLSKLSKDRWRINTAFGP